MYNGGIDIRHPAKSRRVGMRSGIFLSIESFLWFQFFIPYISKCYLIILQQHNQTSSSQLE